MAEKNNLDKSLIDNNFIFSLLFIFIFFVSPIIFFTDLTRNPYYFQITLLNISLLLIAFFIFFKALKNNFLYLNFNSYNKLSVFILFTFFLTSLIGYFGHNDFFKPAIFSESRRIWIFTLINCFFPFYLAQNIKFISKEEIPYWKYIVFIFIWGILWMFFPFLRQNYIGDNLFLKIWDFYGGVLWLGAIWFLYKIIKNGINYNSLIHLAMLTSVLASLYGILQYFGIEFIWAKLINPYGRRAVSTFGNPNFISSYVLMIIPIAIYYLVISKKNIAKLFYSLVILSAIGMIFASLTRSSLLGLIFSLIFIFLFKEVRNYFIFSNKTLKKTIILVLLLLILWPDQTLKPASFGVFNRIFEGVRGSFSKISLSVKREDIYSSFHQRLLIWSSAFNMFRENPITGKGWGSFELFYPYYQGDLIKKYPNIQNLRTHANNAHNEILEILSQTGILGLGICFLFLFLLFFHSFKYIKTANFEDKFFVITHLASIIGMLVDNMLNVSIHFAIPAFLFWWILGSLVGKFYSGYNEKVIKENRNIYIKIIAIPVLLFSILGIYFWNNQFKREVYYFDGFKLVRKNNYFEAERKLKKAYDYNDREVNNNYELANAYVRLNEYDKAIWAYKEALKANSGYDEIFFNLGVIQKKVNLDREAIDNLKVSVFINPLNKTAYQAIIELFLKNPLSYADEAVSIIDHALTLFPDEPSFYNYAGYFLTFKKDYLHAKDYYEKGLEIKPMDNLLYENLKGVLITLGEKKSQVLDFATEYREIDKMIIENPNLALEKISKFSKEKISKTMFLYLKSKALFKIGQIDKAKDLLIEVLNRKDNFNEARWGLAVIYEKKGLFDEAKRQWQKILEYEPNNQEVQERLKKL